MSTIRDDAWNAVGAPAASANGYGSYALTAAGVWTYTLDNNNAAVQALNVGGTLTDTFTVTTVDGTAQLVTITINGANDAAVITGTSSGAVTEAGGVDNGTPGVPTATGDLNADRCRQPDDAWNAVSRPAAARQRLRQLHADGGRRVDLHARQQQSGRAGAQRRRHADRHVHASPRSTAPRSW